MPHSTTGRTLPTTLENAFVDRAGYLAHIDVQEQRFEEMLREQQAAHLTVRRRAYRPLVFRRYQMRRP